MSAIQLLKVLRKKSYSEREKQFLRYYSFNLNCIEEDRDFPTDYDEAFTVSKASTCLQNKTYLSGVSNFPFQLLYVQLPKTVCLTEES